MTFDEILDQIRELLRQRGRVTYRSLRLRYQLDDELLAGITDELIKAERVAEDENGEVLVWKDSLESSVQRLESEGQSRASTVQTLDPRHQTLDSTAERRQLTVMFCDLVDSTALSAQLDPEELREVVRAYQDTCTAVVRRYDGYIAQHLGDGLLVYFGYPTAHEDEAQRAVRTGLEIIEALQSRARQQATNAPLPYGRGSDPLRVRIGIHTGLVVIGEIGSSEKREILALGETPNLAARIQGQANPDEVGISAVTYRLVEGLFACEDRGQPVLKGVTAPLTLYRVLKESAAHSRFEAAIQKGLTPLVGREEELALLRRRWEQAKEGEGQVVLLSGEAGIGKSRLVKEMKDRVSAEGATRIEFRCSPYHQNSASYPILDHLQRLLQFTPEDAPQHKLAKLQQALAQYRFPQAETLALLAALLSLPQPEGLPPLTLSPQKQKEKTQEALVAWIVEEAERQAVYLVWEDLHWIDPSSLDVLTLILQQLPIRRSLVVLTYRPDFTPPWRPRTHSTQLTLTRLGRQHVTAMVTQVMTKAVLSVEVVQQIVSRTDGVPLFVEELTKSIVEAVGAHGRVPLQTIAIPATLQDSLMARLDRLGAAKAVAQLGATLGREFSYDLLQAVSPVDATALQQALQQLIDAELLYQRGMQPQATYVFKHALIQDTAYQSLLKSTRQQYHQQIAQRLEEQFLDTKETQPELLAHHYTEAGLVAQAIPYWQQAGNRASQRSAYVEAISHLTRGVELLNTLPDTLERTQRELTLLTTLGPALIATRGYAATEVEQVYTRAWELVQQIGQTPQESFVLNGLWNNYAVQGKHKIAYEFGEQLLTLAQREQDPALLILAHHALTVTLFYLEELPSALAHVDQALALYNRQKHHSLTFLHGHDPRVSCLLFAGHILWSLGYPDQALARNYEAIAWAQELAHPYSLAYALTNTAWRHQLRQEAQAARERAEEAIVLCKEQGFSLMLAQGTIWWGWALAEQGEVEEGVKQIRQGLAAWRATRAELALPYFLTLLAGTYEKMGQVEEGLAVVDEGLAIAHRNNEQWYEAELCRLQGELLLKSKDNSSKAKFWNLQLEGEECFRQAISIAYHRNAKSLELRAARSLARLWQQQGKKAEAHKLLSEIYKWFTEGFDTKDLQEAKALLEELSA